MVHINTTLQPGPGRSAIVDRYVNRLRKFWSYYQKRESLEGLSLSSIYALFGGQEARFSGSLVLRTDLEAAAYLEAPFVRRAWRLLRLLEDIDDRSDCVPAEDPTVAESAAADGVAHCRFPDDTGGNGVVSYLSHEGCRRASRCGSSISISWKAAREIGMDPATSRINTGFLMTVLIMAGFLDPTRKGGLTPRAASLVRFGTIGEFYKALVIRVFNRVPWIFDDALPGLSAIQYHGLFLTYVVLVSSGKTSLQLANSLRSVVAEASRVPGTTAVPGTSRLTPASSRREECGVYWISDVSIVSAAIHARYLTRVGRMLGIFESDDSERFRGTHLARRAFCWQF